MITLSLFQIITAAVLITGALIEAFALGWLCAKDERPKAKVLQFRRRL